jgi:translocation and assembly module TamA
LTAFCLIISYYSIAHICFAHSKKEPVQITFSIIENKNTAIYKKFKKLTDTIKEEINNKKNTLDEQQIAYWQEYIKKTFIAAAHSYGYYDADADIVSEKIGTSDDVSFHLRLSLNKPYYVSGSSIETNTTSTLIIPTTQYKTNQLADAQFILDEQKSIQKYVEENNCVYNTSISHNALIDRTNNTIFIKYIIKSSEPTNIKSVEFIGMKSVNPEYIRQLTDIEVGSCYKNSKLLNAGQELENTGLFSTVSVKIVPEKVEQNRIPVVFSLLERRQKTVKLGINYSTDFGIGGHVSWEHRNAFGNGEQVVAKMEGNKKQGDIDLKYIKPFWHQKNQTLKIGTHGKKENTTFYKNRISTSYVTVEQKISAKNTFGKGLKYSFIETLEENTLRSTYQLVSFPLYFSSDRRDDPLDSHKGLHLHYELEPFVSVKINRQKFLKQVATASAYYSIPTLNMLTLATRVSVGAINFSQNQKIPVPERFYIGGNNSIRGYRYQFAGLLNKKRLPKGGKSFFTQTFESRIKISETTGAVLFIDYGANYDVSYPRLHKKMFIGYGIGMRYFTTFGPLKFDIAVPGKKRHKIDRGYQLYFGIGQSF